jgi:hypothetical protein
MNDDEDSREPAPTVSGSVIGGHNIQLGFVGGDVTLLFNAPNYHVEFLSPSSVGTPVPPSSDRPSYLLDPRHQIVPYRSRPVEESRLEAWLGDRKERVSVLMLTGPAGQGKTRLAGHVASSCHAKGWAVGQAVPHGPRQLSASRMKATLLTDTQPLIVVVDYAERWRLDVLTELVANLSQDHRSRRLRVLMLSREGQSVWETVAAELDRIQLKLKNPAHEDPGDSERDSVELVKPIALGEFTAQRVEAFADAIDAFRRHLKGPHVPQPPVDVHDAVYGSPLTLHMAALAAAYAAAGARPAPDNWEPQALSRYLLNHERRYWEATSAAPMGTAAMPTNVIEETVWWATLFGPVVSQKAALGVLRAVRLADGPAEAERLLNVYERLYPPVREARTGQQAAHSDVVTLLPMQPDRLGEDLVGSYLASHPHALEKIANLIGTEDGPRYGTGTLDLRRCMTVLTGTADRHPAAADALFALLRQRPVLAVLGGPVVVQFVADHAPADLAGAVGEQLPVHSTPSGPTLPQYDADLVGPAASLARRFVTQLPAGAAPELRASLLLNLGNRLAHLSRHEEARVALSEAAGIYRRLAVADPGYRPCLELAESSLLNVRILELFARHVLTAGEEITRVRLWPDGLAVTTSILRHLVAGSEARDWLVSREEWVEDVVIATRDDIIVHGQPQRYGFLLLTGGGEVYLNDPAAVAALGRRLHDGLDRAAYAQLIVQFHPYTSATQEVLTRTGELRRKFGHDGLPDNDPVRLWRTPDGLVLTFQSSAEYGMFGVTRVDLKAWTVRVPTGGPAQWESRDVAVGMSVSPWPVGEP